MSEPELSALLQACAPVGLLRFPATDIIRTLRQYGYIEIVLGGVQITPHGLERLLRERQRRAFHVSSVEPGRCAPRQDGL